MSTSRWTAALALLTAVVPLAVRAAGADGSWTWCAAPARLQPIWWGRTWHVATWGTDPWSCPSSAGYTFRTIPAAVKCSWGGDTVLVHNGTYGPFTIINKWQNDDILITNAPGESPVIDGWSSVGDYQAIVSLWNVSHIAIQGLTIQNTGVPDAEHGGYGIKVNSASNVKVYFNTIRNTSRHGVMLEGNSMELVGNDIGNTSMRNQWRSSDWWDASFANSGSIKQWGLKVVGNDIHDSWGECLDIINVSGATVEGNRVHNCYSAHVYVSNSESVTLNRNYVYANNDNYTPWGQYRPIGIGIANEGTTTGFTARTIRVTNNIVEGTGQAFRYWRSHSGTAIWDMYADVYVGFNTFARTQTWPVRFDGPDGNPQGWNRFRRNLVINNSGWDYFSTVNWNNWEVASNYNYSWGTSTTNPGVVYTGGGWPGAYQLRSDSAIRWSIPPWSESGAPSQDYYCQNRNLGDWSYGGALK